MIFYLACITLLSYLVCLISFFYTLCSQCVVLVIFFYFFRVNCSVLLNSPVTVSDDSLVPNETTAIYPSFTFLSYLMFMPCKSCFSCNFCKRSRSLILSDSMPMTCIQKLFVLLSLLFSFSIMY